VLSPRLEPADGRDRNRLRRELLDAPDHPGVEALGEGHRETVASGAAGTADPVHVVLGLHRQPVVHDVADRRHVDAARRDVGRDEDAQVARAQALQDAVAPPLGHAAVQRRDRMAELREAIGETVGVDLRAGEDERLLDSALGQDAVEQGVLVREVVGPVQALLDVGVAVGVRGDVDALRRAQQLLREARDVAHEGRAVHHGLACRRQMVGDRRDVVDEAHVEHAIGFVEDEHLDVVEHGLAALQMVDQPARRRDQDVERPAQGLELRRIGNAADDRRDAHAGDMAAIDRGRLGDLQGELARRREDEDARSVDGALFAPLAGIGARREDAAERRQDERRGLAAAGRSGDHQVAPGERRRDGGRLDVGGRAVAGIGDSAYERLGQAEGFKGHDGFPARRSRHQGAIATASPPTLRAELDVRVAVSECATETVRGDERIAARLPRQKARSLAARS